MTTVQQIIDALLLIEDKSKEICIYHGGRCCEGVVVSEDHEGVYFEAEGK